MLVVIIRKDGATGMPRCILTDPYIIYCFLMIACVLYEKLYVYIYIMYIYIYATLPGPTIYDKRLMFEGSFLND